jgi:translocation and assembly module TamB
VIRGVEARVHIGGSARSPELDLSSSPPLEEAEVLSLIAFNQPINELGEGERVSLAERAAAVAGGFVAAPLARSIANALNVDVFEIQATSEGGAIGPRVTIGQQISDRLFVRFSQEFGPQEISELTLEYLLGEFLRIQATGSQGDTARANRSLTRRVERAGIDLIFFFSY